MVLTFTILIKKCIRNYLFLTFSILPLVQPELNKTEIQTFTSLIDCMFETNVESEENDNEKELESNKSGDKIFTAQDLLKKLNKTNNLEAMDMDEELDEMLIGEERKQYGIWTLLPGKYRFLLQKKKGYLTKLILDFACR